MSNPARFVATKDYYGSTRYLTDELTHGIALGITARWDKAVGFATQAEVDEFVEQNERIRGGTWRLSSTEARPRIAVAGKGALFISRLHDNYTLDSSEARPFSSQAEIDEYVRQRPGILHPGWKLTHV